MKKKGTINSKQAKTGKQNKTVKSRGKKRRINKKTKKRKHKKTWGQITSCRLAFMVDIKSTQQLLITRFISKTHTMLTDGIPTR